MQLLANGRDHVAQSYAEGPLTLHRLVDGTYQFGVGKDASVVSSIEQVKKFDERVQMQVEHWLASGGYERALEAKRTLDLAESATGMPGSLEAAILARGGAALLGQIHALITASKHQGATPAIVPPNVLRPDPKVKDVVVVDEEDEEELGHGWTDPVEALAATEEIPASKVSAPDPPAPSTQMLQDMMTGIAALSEAIGTITQRIEKIEQHPKRPARKRVRPSRAKKPAAKPATT